MCVTLTERYLRAANRINSTLNIFLKYNSSALKKKFFFWFVFFYDPFETADLPYYCGIFLAICQLCSKCVFHNILGKYHIFVDEFYPFLSRNALFSLIFYGVIII